MTALQLANRELSVALAEALLRFFDGIDGGEIDGPLATLRNEVRQAYEIRNAHVRTIN